MRDRRRTNLEEVMRLQSKTKVVLRDKVLGGPLPLSCLPLVAKDKAELIDQATEVRVFQPDVIEWRVDKLDAVRDTKTVLAVLETLRAEIGSIPLIFTCRVAREGGFQEIAQDDRLDLNKAVIASGLADLIDTEMSNGEAMIAVMTEQCRQSECKLILSYHNFNETPAEQFILERLSEAQRLGADVAKVAVMPKNYRDVLNLLSATYTARTELVDIPIITMSMGAEGGITRIAGGLFGSDLTFAIGKASSAPGQIPIDDLRKTWSALSFE
jgi:3-dehydroquinate dehydratase-1